MKRLFIQQITGYTPANKDNWDSEWCNCDYC